MLWSCIFSVNELFCYLFYIFIIIYIFFVEIKKVEKGEKDTDIIKREHSDPPCILHFNLSLSVSLYFSLKRFRFQLNGNFEFSLHEPWHLCSLTIITIIMIIMLILFSTDRSIGDIKKSTTSEHKWTTNDTRYHFFYKNFCVIMKRDEKNL